MLKKSKVKLQDIAKQVGVSVATVSMAFDDNPKVNPDTMELIKKVSRKLGYVKPVRVVTKDGIVKHSQKRFGYI